MSGRTMPIGKAKHLLTYLHRYATRSVSSQFYANPATYLPRIPITRSIAKPYCCRFMEGEASDEDYTDRESRSPKNLLIERRTLRSVQRASRDRRTALRRLMEPFGWALGIFKGM